MAKDTTRSPQNDAIEDITWARLPGFWSTNMDPSDRDAITALYESMGNVLDAEYIRLFEINKAKAVATCPIFTQRRWLRLDLNRYYEMKQWLRFLAGGQDAALNGQGSQTSVNTDMAICESFDSNHSKHWHISFPFLIDPSVPDVTRRTVQLAYPILSGLVEVYRVTKDEYTRKTGVRLSPGKDFELLPDGTSLHIKKALPGEVFEIQAGLDLGGEAYDGVRPTIFRVKTRLSPNVVAIPPQLDTGHPVHALVLRQPSKGSEGGVIRTNNDSFSTLRQFFPYTGDAATGLQRGSLGQVVFPVGTSIGDEDIVFLFTTELGEYNTLHKHEHESFRLDRGNANAFGTESFTPPAAIQRGLFGSVGQLGHELQLYLGGKLVHPSEYRYDLVENTFVMRVPIVFKYGINVAVHFTSELRADPSKVNTLHLHSICYIEKAETEKVYERYDDGGEYDDDTDPQPFFDSMSATNVVYAPVALSPESMEVYVDGALTRPGADYVVQIENNRTRIAFSIIIEGKTVLLASERRSAIHAYSVDDILGFSGNGYGFSFKSLGGALNDLTNLVDIFKQAYGTTLTNLAALVEAATVASNGGNPILSLFYDEYPEYIQIAPDSDNVSMTAANARNIESANTSLINIPFLVDHVSDPTARMDAGVDFEVVDGGIYSSVDLLAPRSDMDENPGVWWCPVVILDEHLLAKNFGALVDDVQDSSARYREMLQANLRLRYGGPVIETMQDAANVMLGSSAFRQDSRVLGVDRITVGWTVTLVGSEASFQQVEVLPVGAQLPKAGQLVVPGQSISHAALYDGTLKSLVSFANRTLIVAKDIYGPQAGDVVRIQLHDPANLSLDPVWVLFTLTGIDQRPVLGGIETLMSLDIDTDLIPLQSSRMIITRDVGSPYASFTGAVTDISPIERAVLRTESETFDIPLDYASAYQPGDYVRRGDPLDPRQAEVYDYMKRPDWHWLKPENLRAAWQGLLGRNSRALRADGLADERYVSMQSGANGYGELTASPSFPLPPRGTIVTVQYDESTTTKVFTVVGISGTTILISPNPGELASGKALFELPPDRAGDKQREYFEVPAPRRTNGGRYYTNLRYGHRAYTPALSVDSIADWPQVGAVHIRLPFGGQIEVEYYGHKDTQLTNLVWPTDIPALMTPAGVFDPRIPGGVKIDLIWQYKAKRLHPVFVDLVQRRVERDYSTLNGVAFVDDTNADQYYDLLKTSSAVLSTAKVGQPAAMVKAIEDTLPPGTTLVIESRHVINEVFQPGARDNVTPADRVETFHPMIISFSSPHGVVDATNTLHVDSAIDYVSVSVAVADPDSGSVEYEWSVRAVRGSSAGLMLTDPMGASTQLRGVQPSGRYYLTMDATNSLGQVKSATLVVVADI